MPHTAAHPAAVIPLQRLLGRRCVGSALVIGSMAPDFVYYLPLGLERAASHSLEGLLLVVLPLGLAAQALFHGLLRRPLEDLLPAPQRARLASAPQVPATLRPGYVLLVTLSLLLGGATHLLWDACTHRGGFVVQQFAPLGQSLWVVGDYDIRGYKVLQHGSTLVGLTCLALCVRAWFRRSPPASEASEDSDPPARARRRWIVVLLVALAALAAGLPAGFGAPDKDGWLQHLQYFAGPALRTGTSAAVLTLLAYCLVWHAAHRRTRQP